MTTWRYVIASLWQFRRTHLAVAAGVAVATAVITGALLVGDSVRGSLRDLVLKRLGNVVGAIVAEQPFRAELADDLAEHFQGGPLKDFVPLLLIPGSMSTAGGEQVEQATQLSIMGVTDEYWKLGDNTSTEAKDPSPSPSPEYRGGGFQITGDEAIITKAVANELRVAVGDEVLLRVAVPSNIPADSTLGEKTDATTVRRLKVAAILNRGIARFSLRPSQLEPRNVFVPLATLQRLLNIRGKANVIAVEGTDIPLPLRERDIILPILLKLADFGLKFEEFLAGNNRYVQLSAERLVIAPNVVETVEVLFTRPRGQAPRLEPQEVVTYLANAIELGGKKVPYSTVTGIKSNDVLGPIWDEEGKPIVLADDEIVLNDWAAERLGAKVGDRVTLKYYEPETTHGELVERTTPPLTVRYIAPLKEADGNPTAVADEHFTPELPGVTDERSISDWELPFKLVEKISQADEDYWDEYRTTPKAFVSLSLAEKLWSSRWGTTSAVRFPATDRISAEFVSEKLTAAIDPTQLGMKWLPLREQGLAASRGTTAFEGLFLGFSFFLMASAVMLVALLFRLGAESRAAEVGILSAVGWDSHRVRKLWLVETGIVAVLGAAIGALGGILYAALMVFGLNTWWVAATVTPFLQLHVNTLSLTIGFAMGVLVSLATVAWSLRRFTRLAPRQLLAGDTRDPRNTLIKKQRWSWLPPVLIATAVLVGIGATFAQLQDEAQAGAFFTSGALVLTAMIVWLRHKLREPTMHAPSGLSLAGLAVRNARRAPSRTIMSVGLAAVASFLIVALSAFRLAPSEGGTGGYDLIATADVPVHFDLNTPEGRKELGFSAGDEKQLEGVEVASFRVRGGEDASCLNLYQTSQPTVIGVPESFYDNGTRFEWAATRAASSDLPWELLDTGRGEDEKGLTLVPVVLDKNTATYSLHLGGLGSRFTIRDSFDQEVTLEVVGLLSGSIFQGYVMMSEENFLRLYPDAAGMKLFLVRNKNTRLPNDELASVLETRVVDHGFDVVSADAQLAEFMAVQNTYLSTFQSLGALGLLLGTVGLAVAQLRSVIERRGELALLRSAGFNRSRLAEMVLGENVSLLFAGLGCGCVAALVATLPHWLLARADIPWATLAVLLGVVALSGVLAGWLAVRAAIRAPLVAALRGE